MERTDLTIKTWETQEDRDNGMAEYEKFPCCDDNSIVSREDVKKIAMKKYSDNVAVEIITKDDKLVFSVIEDEETSETKVDDYRDNFFSNKKDSGFDRKTFITGFAKDITNCASYGDLTADIFDVKIEEFSEMEDEELRAEADDENYLDIPNDDEDFIHRLARHIMENATEKELYASYFDKKVNWLEVFENNQLLEEAENFGYIHKEEV